MTFLVSDSQQNRHAKIKKFINQEEPVIAVLLAAVDFEWTIRRAIIALGTSPNADIRGKTLRNCSGLKQYKEAWGKEVKKRFGKGLAEITTDWNGFKQSFELRHRLVHGIAGSTGVGYAQLQVERILQTSSEIVDFANKQGVDLYSRLPVRQNKRS